MLEIRTIPHCSPEYRETVELRRRILRTPLGLDFTADDLAAEDGEYHVAGYVGGRLAGCLVLVPLDAGDVKMRQVAVDGRIQRTGIGTRLVEYSERFAKDQGFFRMILNARDSAVPFYQRLGYEIEGDQFVEVGIPHFKMVKRLIG